MNEKYERPIGKFMGHFIIKIDDQNHLEKEASLKNKSFPLHKK